MQHRRPLLIGIVAAAVLAATIAAFLLGVFAPIHFREVATIPLDHHETYSLAWSPDGSALAVLLPGKLWLYSADDLEAEPRIFTDALEDYSEVIYSPAGTQLALLGSGGIQLRAMPSGEVLHVLSADVPITVAIAYSADGLRIASAHLTEPGDDSYTIRVWDTTTADLLLTIEHPNQPLDVAYSPDGGTLATVDCRGGYPQCNLNNILLWDALTGEQVGTLELPHPPDALGLASTTTVRFSPDGSTLAGYGMYEDLQVWDWQAHDLRHYLVPSREVPLSGYDDVEFTADGRFLATVGLEDNIELWDVRSGKVVARIKGTYERGRTMVFSPDGLLLAVIGEEGVLRFWRVLP
jgi:WD40 repeat protein